MYQFNPYAIPPFVASIYILFSGLFIFLLRRRIWTNFICSLAYYCSAIWLFGYFMLYSTKKPDSLFWPKFVYIGVVFIPPTFYHFTVVLLSLKKQRKFVLLTYLVSLCFLTLILFTDNFIVGLKKFFWGYHTKVNPLFHSVFLTFFFITYVSGLKNLFNAYRKRKLQQGQPLAVTHIKYLLLGYSIASLGAVDYIPDWGTEFYPFGGYIFISIATSFVAYAIVKYRLLDITVAITRTGIFIGVYTLVLGIPFAISGWFKSWLIGMLGVNWWILPLGLMAGLATVGPFIYIYLDRRAEKRLLYEQHRYQETLKQAAREMARIRNLKKLLNLIVHTVTKTVRISYAGIYLFDTKLEQFFLEVGRNLKKGQIVSIGKENPLILWFKDYKESLVYEEINRKVQENFEPIFKELEEQMRFLNATVIVPGFLEDRLIGLLVLGDKRSGKIYSSEDLNTFSLLANQAALAIENALLYENIEGQVRQRTKELIEVQKQLVQAEKLATMGTLAGGVAHEINNPLTAILTNVQMLLASDTIDDKLDRESLELIEEATKRCRTIVQKLIAYAKKPLGTVEVSRINLLNVINKVISFFGYQLEQDNIKVIFEIKENDFMVMGNQNELEQVLTNIVLNARDAIKRIKKSGDIYISLLKSEDWIKIVIKDGGAGIPKDIISKIFDPFFTTKEVGKGLGLGLSICQAIVEKHNGLISVQSEVNKGSTFTIQLPKVEAKSSINITEVSKG